MPNSHSIPQKVLGFGLSPLYFSVGLLWQLVLGFETGVPILLITAVQQSIPFPNLPT